MDNLIALLFQIIMLPISFFVGGTIERRHLRSLTTREAQLADIRVCNLKHVTEPESVARASMVVGQVVVATDYYKSFAASLRNLVGGEIRSAEKMMLRGRREALVRALTEAHAMGATELWNVRFGFCNVSQMQGRRTGAMQVEVYAWGTAVVRR